jgi:hypothetical protein
VESAWSRPAVTAPLSQSTTFDIYNLTYEECQDMVEVW